MEQQLVQKTEGDDDVMIALNKKVAEWKVRMKRLNETFYFIRDEF